MQSNRSKLPHGQSLVEYSLVVALVALGALAVLLLVGGGTGRAYERASEALGGGNTEDQPSAAESLTGDFLERIRAYYAANGYWPRSWGAYRFSDLGLNPNDWNGPVEGIFWNPNGNKLGLANRPGDNLQIYVTGKDQQVRKLYDGWNIWCVASDGRCYYHTVDPENEIDLDSLIVVQE